MHSQFTTVAFILSRNLYHKVPVSSAADAMSMALQSTAGISKLACLHLPTYNKFSNKPEPTENTFKILQITIKFLPNTFKFLSFKLTF